MLLDVRGTSLASTQSLIWVLDKKFAQKVFELRGEPFWKFDLDFLNLLEVSKGIVEVAREAENGMFPQVLKTVFGLACNLATPAQAGLRQTREQAFPVCAILVFVQARSVRSGPV